MGPSERRRIARPVSEALYLVIGYAKSDRRGGASYSTSSGDRQVSRSGSVAERVVIVFPVGAVVLAGFALVAPQRFGAVSASYPFAMGFAKLFLLGTFGEMLKYRLTKGSWLLDKSLQRGVVWGVYGLWFTMAFAGFSSLVEGIVARGLWPASLANAPSPLWIAFSKSLWINLLGMFGPGMMVSHEYFNYLIRNGWRSWSLNKFAEQCDPKFVLSFIPKTLLFWIPAHTFTFAMPAEWRVFIAAMLAIVLGFLLSVARR